MQTRSRSVPAGLLTLALGASGLLAACDVGADEDGARAAAEKVAGGLAGRDLTGLPVDDAQGAASYPGIVRGLRPDPTVTVGDVEVDGDRATAKLAWSWPLGAQSWTYESELTLEADGDDWTAAWSPQAVHPDLADGEVLDVDVLAADRGDITGARGRPLVTERDVLRYGLDKARVTKGQVAASARRIAQLLDIEVAPYVRTATAAGPKAFVEALVLRADEGRLTVPDAYADVPGAATVADQLPLAATREFAAPILGRVGDATAEIVEKSEGRVQPGDEVGLSGLQARYDEQLAGRNGYRVDAVAADDSVRELVEEPAEDGTDLALTLDPELQRKAERVLAAAYDEDGPVTALVALRPSTGDVLAAANGPGNGGLNAATFGQYAPGSTFKVVTALALLRAGLTEQSPVDCPATTVVDGKTFKNYDDYPAGALGRITLRQAIANSCNTALIGQAGELGDTAVAQAAAALGLGVDHDLGFPAYFGQVPPPAGATEKAADLIGQGKVLASPLAMAAVAASVRAGHAVLPRLLADHEVEQTAPAAPLTRREAAQLRAMMRAVVTEGSGAFLSSLPGEVGAKTGTAEYGAPDASGALPTHTWMIATRGDLAVAVFVETGESGSRTAGPLLRAFLE